MMCQTESGVAAAVLVVAADDSEDSATAGACHDASQSALPFFAVPASTH